MDNEQIVEWVGYIAPLGIMSLSIPLDIRRREILLIPTVAGVAAGAVYVIFTNEGTSPGAFFFYFLASAAPGIFLMLLAVATKGKVGCGDGIIVLMTGVWTGFLIVQLSLMAALILVLIIGLSMRRKEVPFVPFLAAGYVVALLFENFC
ncbi:MAG: hypothetical protein SOI56_05110 [Eubacteriales bacterium]|jgi:leader peptidase (prepilin peptidase)/N-methyltransferase